MHRFVTIGRLFCSVQRPGEYGPPGQLASSPLRILLVNPYDLTHPGGVTTHVSDLAHQFRLMGHDVQIAGPAGQGLLPKDGFTHSLGSTMKFLSPGDSARVNLNPFI